MAKQQTPYRMTALADIKPYDRNPRIIPQAAVDAVARSIQAFGFRQPIVVDGNGVILAGHTRYKAAQQLGMAEVPVVWQTDITDIQARGYRIADNKVAELSAWDRDALDAEVRELADLGDIDIGAVGLADWELERILREDEPVHGAPEEAPPRGYNPREKPVAPLPSYPELLNADGPQFRTMTFTLTQEQYDTCILAVQSAIVAGSGEATGNKNGAAFYLICKEFNAMQAEVEKCK